ncbi:MAG: hypothetical protein WAT71_17205 [Ignavibacteria bacterium]
MKDSRLIELLSTFDEEELNSFKKFLLSPFNKSKRNIGSLLNYLISIRLEFNSEKSNKEFVFKKLFPGEKFNYKKLENLTLDLYNSAKSFLVHKTIEEDELECQIFLSKAFYNKKLSEHSMKTLAQVEKKLKPEFISDKDYFSKLRQITFLKSAYYTKYNEFDNLIESKRNYFEASATQFIIDSAEFLSIRKPVLDTHGKNIENYFIESVMKSFDIDKMIKLLEKDDNANIPIITLHYYRLKTIDEPDTEDHYFKLRDYFYENLDNLNRGEKCFIFNHLTSYCVNKLVGKDKSDFEKEGLDVYKKMLENNAYSMSESEYMQPLMYRNIYQFCNVTKDSKWFKIFIDEYSFTLDPEYRKDLSNMAYAYYFFMIKKFEKALEMISGIRGEFFLFKSDLKNLSLKIYYEVGYIEQAYSLVDAHRHFLANSKEISAFHKDAGNKFLKYYNTLLKIKCNQSKEDPGLIKSKLIKEEKIASKVWLIEKADELIK